VSSAARDPALDRLLDQVARARGFRGDVYKQGCILRRLTVRMRARGSPSYEAYAELLRGDPAEYDHLLDALTINVSRFYRNPDTWDVLARSVLPALLARRSAGLRAWSAGCAAGEEPYTLAMLLTEHARGRGTGEQWPAIHATDYDRGSLARAAAGCYPRAALKELPAALVARYFQPGDPAQLVPEVRRLVHFARHDLVREAPPGPPYDLIICRNVVIYFDRPTQERLCSVLADALAPGGYLVLGKVEVLRGEARARLVLDNARERIYRTR
jgi:chemotaxis protein methyltransferase CheR